MTAPMSPNTAVPLLQAFTRCAQQEPENGEAWNNLAAIHLQLQRPAEAFNALSEAVRVKRDSWQTWGNYAQAAAQTAHWLQAARGVLQVRLAGGCLHGGAAVQLSRLSAVGATYRSAQQVPACRQHAQPLPGYLCKLAAVGGQARDLLQMLMHRGRTARRLQGAQVIAGR